MNYIKQALRLTCFYVFTYLLVAILCGDPVWMSETPTWEGIEKVLFTMWVIGGSVVTLWPKWFTNY